MIPVLLVIAPIGLLIVKYLLPWFQKKLDKQVVENSEMFTNKLWVQRMVRQDLFSDYYELEPDEQKKLLFDTLGWDLTGKEVIHMELSVMPVISMSMNHSTVKGYIAFDTSANMMVWKLAHQLKD